MAETAQVTKIIDTLSANDTIVDFSNALSRWAIIQLVDVPDEQAEALAGQGWRDVYFQAEDQNDFGFHATMTIGRPFYTLTPNDWTKRMPQGILDSAGEGIREDFGEDDIASETNRWPMMLAERSTGFYPNGEETDMKLVLYKYGASFMDYWHPADTKSGRQVLSSEDTASLLLPEEQTAIDGLHRALIEASRELLGIKETVTV